LRPKSWRKDRKLFLGLESTNQGMHRRQPGTVLSTGGCPRHSGNVLTPTAAVASSAGAVRVKKSRFTWRVLRAASFSWPRVSACRARGSFIPALDVWSVNRTCASGTN